MVWQEVTSGSNVWVYEYVANGYKANAVALPLDDGELAIVSPPIGLSEADFAAIDQQGKVAALIAPHSGHDLGQNEWQARYPDAIPYAPAISIEQLRHIGRLSFTPVSKLFASTVEFREVPGTKKGGTIAIVHQAERPIVYVDELVINWSALPKSWTRVLFWWAKSAPGLNINRVYARLLCPDVQAVARTVLEALANNPVIIPAHGVPLVDPDDAARVRALVEPFAKSIAQTHP
ncbi:hypothetical protein ACKFKF_33255 [Phormidesmis sp. 146-12]